MTYDEPSVCIVWRAKDPGTFLSNVSVLPWYSQCPRAVKLAVLLPALFFMGDHRMLCGGPCSDVVYNICGKVMSFTSSTMLSNECVS